MAEQPLIPPAPRFEAPALAKVEIPEERDDLPRTFVVVTMVLVVLLGTGGIGANIAVDPRSEFSTGWLPPLVIDWVHASVVRYQQIDPPVEDLVLGASRAGTAQGLPGREGVTFTFFAAGSPPPDWLDEYHYIKRHQGPPQRLIVVVDQSAFTSVFSPRVPRSVDADVVQGHGRSWGDHVALAVHSLSLGYLRDSLHSLQLRYITGYPVAPSGDANPVFARPNLMEDWRTGTFDPSQVDPRIEAQSERAFGAGHQEVQEYRSALGRLLDEATLDGVDVWAVLPPYQPVALADLEARYPGLMQETTNVRQFLVDRCPSIHVIDATHVEDVGVDPSEFFDQSHMTPKGSAQLMEALAAGRGDACP